MTPVPLARLIEKWRTNEVIGDRSKQTFAQCADELEALLAEQEQQPPVALHELREMWLNYPGLGINSLSHKCFQELSPEQAEFYAKACEVAISSPQPAKEAGDATEIAKEIWQRFFAATVAKPFVEEDIAEIIRRHQE